MLCRPESWKLRYMDVFHHCGLEGGMVFIR
jgi:hypothetical protein